MKDLLLRTAERTELVDAEKLRRFFEENEGKGRIDEALLSCAYFTEDAVLKLFAEALGWEYFADIPANSVPSEFIESVPATYAQHHFLIGIRTEQSNGDLVVVLSKPLDANALDNVSKMTGLPVQAAVSTRTAITAVIDVAYEQRSTVIEEVAEELGQQNFDQLVDEVSASDDLLDVVNRPPVIRLV
ncbi:MAG: GspE/PulE/PilB domain-containing protein, partial [Planctomycetota bacterium]